MEQIYKRLQLHTRKGWTAKDYLVRLLGKTAVRFTYRTVTDGSGKGGSPKGRIRLADGTRNLELVPKSKHPKSFRAYNSRVKTYYDYTKKQWRSFRTIEVIGIIAYLDPKTGQVLEFAQVLED
ncbi:SH3 beta-barrel fold-containing protein [Pontibacter sp. SGAir0037]|uniref:SH3 beta-barrel fold-containing protein n=1 Tax=Pontibacter sp. SGAir0037 TaxID=2571030 RepID=UPI0010CD0EE0|nr:SH3 beta-barrel fold-containing protein [Pontibacter sp. SGAir0037]QCR23767.1 hypothetical protein C1N53_16375 [Pontibacter sp. SGAir0037]